MTISLQTLNYLVESRKWLYANMNGFISNNNWWYSKVRAHNGQMQGMQTRLHDTEVSSTF